MSKIYVVSGNEREFMEYCRSNNLNPRTEAVFAYDEVFFKGIENPKVVYYGSYWKRKDINQLKAVIASRMR